VERSLDRTVVDLDEAASQIQRRWFVWTAAGLRVDPVTWTDRDAAGPAPVVERAEVTTPRSLGVGVFRPNARADVVLYADGWADTAVRRPDTDATVHATAQVDSVEAFGVLLDRVVELITWSGVGRDHSGSKVAPGPQRSPHWVLGFDGLSCR
jgi:hypothetical protein